MQLSRAEHALFTDDVLGGIELDAIQFDLVGVPVGVTFLHNDAAVQLPVFQLEGAVADDIFYPSPFGKAVGGLAKFFNGGPVNRKGAVVVHQLQEVGRGFVQGDLKSELVQCFHAEIIGAGQFTGGVGLCIFNRVQHIGVQVTHCRVERALPGPDIIFCGHGVTIGPPGCGVDIKGDNTAVFTELPAFGNAWLRLQGIGVFHRKAFEQSPDQVAFGNTGHHMGVQPLGLRAIAVV